MSFSFTGFFFFLIYFWLCRVLVETRGIFHCGARVSFQLQHAGFLSLVVACRLQGVWALQLWCAGSRACGLCSLWHTGSLVEARAQKLWHTGLVSLRHVGSQFPDQGSNPRPLNCKADSLPLDHQGSPFYRILSRTVLKLTRC